MNGIPLSFKQVLHRAIWIDLLDIDIGNVRAIPANGPRDSIVEANKEERTAKSTDTADVELAGNQHLFGVGPILSLVNAGDAAAQRLKGIDARQNKPRAPARNVLTTSSRS